jgi:hypothetical protein
LAFGISYKNKLFNNYIEIPHSVYKTNGAVFFDSKSIQNTFHGLLRQVLPEQTSGYVPIYSL